MIRRLALVSAALALSSVAPAAASSHDVTIVDFAFQGGNVSAALGDTVRWTNSGGFTHSSTGDSPLKLWTADVPPTEGRTIHFEQAGSFGFHCRFHSGMVGSVKVPITASDTTPQTGQATTLRVRTSGAPAGFRTIIQRKAEGGSFRAWKTISGQTTIFKSSTAGTWRFRARLQRISTGARSGWSPQLVIKVTAGG